MNRDGLAKPRRRQLHAAFEGTGTQSHERNAVTMLRVHIGLHLENEARDFFFRRINIALRTGLRPRRRRIFGDSVDKLDHAEFFQRGAEINRR